MSERIYCSEVAFAEQAEPAGSAVHVDAWLLIEYPRVWRPKALADNELAIEVNAHLDELTRQAATQGTRLRVQFIKQAGSGDRAQPQIIYCDTRPEHACYVSSRLADYSALTEITCTQLLHGALPNASTPDANIYLVCTNGQRDVCCARFGLPLYEQLRMTYGTRIWQTTHLGGHRFAPNLLCLPSGHVYGFVQPDAGEQVVNTHDSGHLDLARLRGLSHYEPELQAADALLRRANQLTAREALTVYRDEDSLIRYQGNVEGVAELERIDLGTVLASCGAEPKPASTYRLISH